MQHFMVHYFMQKNLLFHASKVQVQTEYIYFEWVPKKWTQKLTQISQDTYFVVICVYIKFRSENPMRNVYSASLWNFFGDPPVCKRRTLSLVRNVINFFHTIPAWNHDISTSPMIFRYCLLFFVFFRMSVHRLAVKFRDKDASTFTFFCGYGISFDSALQEMLQ